MSNAPTVQKDPEWLKGIKEVRERFLAITGKEKETAIELGFATQIINDSEKLRECDKTSIMNAIINVARTGITLNPVLNLAYLINRRGKCCLHFDYKGLVKLLKDYNCIKDIQAIIVYTDETYEDGISQLEPPKHKKKYAKTEAEQMARDYFGVYSQVVLFDNTVVYTNLMPYWEVLKAEKMSPSSDSEHSPWQRNKWRESMIKKTKIRSDFKLFISGNPDDRLKAALEVENAIYSEVKEEQTKLPKAMDLFMSIPEATIESETPVLNQVQPRAQEATIVAPEKDIMLMEQAPETSFFTQEELAKMKEEDNKHAQRSPEEVKEKLDKGKELRKRANM